MITSKLTWKIDPVVIAEKMARGVRNKVLRIAINAGAAPVKAAIIDAAPKGVGNLAQATIIKVINKRKGDCWIAVVGAGSKFKRMKKRNGKSVKNKKTGNKVFVRPGRYQFIQDKGSKYMKGKFYIERTGDATFRQSVQIYKARLKVELEKLNQS